jgi:two-component system response regulator WspF
MTKMRIAIVNDMKMTVEILRRIVVSQPHYEVAWIAYDGKEALEKCAKECPDIILMDLVMPIMDGVEATKEIMKLCPCAILIVTATVSGHASKVFEAMGAGALNVVKTPVMDPETHAVDSKELLNKIDRIGILIGKRAQQPRKTKAAEKSEEVPLLLIGASTGGPMALVEVLSHFPKPFSFAGVIIQHIDEQFSAGLASWLSREAKVPVKIAEPGMVPQTGLLLLAGRNDHLIMVQGGELEYTADPIDNPYRPSVDVFYLSVAKYWKNKGMALLLTGMGGDGAKGMRALLDLGWHTIAQDEASCIVFGMPKAAIAAGGASEVMALIQMAPAIEKFFKMKG